MAKNPFKDSKKEIAQDKKRGIKQSAKEDAAERKKALAKRKGK